MIITEFSVYNDCQDIFIEATKMNVEENLQYISLVESSITIYDIIRIKKIFSFIIKKFIEIITKIWNKFKTLYYSFYDKSKLINKYKNKLLNLKQNVSIDDTIQVYRNFQDNTIINIGRMNINKLIYDFEDFLYNINKISNSESLYSYLISYINDIDDITFYLENLRKEVLGTNYFIKKEDFPQAIVDYFKPENVIESSTFSPKQVKDMTNEFLSIKKTENAIVLEKNIIIDMGNNIKKKIDKININKLVSFDINFDISSKLSNIIKYFSDKLQGICEIYTTIFSIKLDMFREYKSQEINILNKIILNQIKEGK